MNRPALTVLGGSASLAVIVLAGNPAHALMPPALKGDGGFSARMDTQTVRQPLAPEEIPQPAQAVDARIKQLAQAMFGCTCANCMNTVRQMVQQGQLSL